LFSNYFIALCNMVWGEGDSFDSFANDAFATGGFGNSGGGGGNKTKNSGF
uniref:Uncharacterized protein n=1 Tax=Meloidogyne floridensis TaxID=298350 RepID=A0A915NIC9_9BILA